MVMQPLHDPARPTPFEQVGTIERLSATIADLADLPDDGLQYELVRGVLLRMPPPKRLHGVICHRLHRYLDAYCMAQGIADDRLVENIGYNFTGSATNETVLAPDLSLAQATVSLAVDAPYESTPPLLAIEVVSPSESRAYMADKATTYLHGGVALVWIVWPDKHTVDVWTNAGMTTLTAQDTLTGGTVLPTFELMVASIFPD